ncbi:MAG: hypothetical protein OEU46_14010, partial [Alphaproteobacteria bacterium]|nr:hypothetical protein [Alphaproteobacteria bacterium]
ETDHAKAPLVPSATSRLTSTKDEPDPPVRDIFRRPKRFDDGQFIFIFIFILLVVVATTFEIAG